jgi:cell volume regulation protein A
MPIILATYLLLANLPQAELILNVVVFTITTSVLVQGTPYSTSSKTPGD